MRARSFVVAIALCLCAAASSPRVAVATSDAIDGLHAELVDRRDVDLAGVLDKAHKKQLAGVRKALAQLDKPAANLAARVKALLGAAKTLAKAFPSEFAATKSTASLRDLVVAAVGDFRALAEDEYRLLADAVPGVKNATLRVRAEAQRVKAREQLDLAAAAPTFLEALKDVGLALKFVKKGLTFVAKDPFVETVSASLDGVPFAAKNVAVEHTSSVPLVVMNGNSQSPGVFRSIELSSSNIGPVTGVGTFTVSATVRVGVDPGTLTAVYSTNNATLTVSTLDTAAKTLKATFSFVATSPGGSVTVTDGVVDTRRMVVVP
jgi:hypothetical protein